MNSKKHSLIVTLILGAALAVTIMGLYWPTLGQLFNQLINDEDYSFGLLLPLVSAYIIYLKWPQIRSWPWQPSWKGLVVIGLGLCVFILSKFAADMPSARISFLIVLGGITVLLGGWALLRFLAFPLLLLFFMMPLPTLFISQVTLPLQLLSSQIAAGLLRGIGIPLVRQGNVIDLGVRQLQVVSACSGLRYILSLMALGLIFNYFYQRRLWKAAILIIAVIPAAIMANAIRVAAMGLFPALVEGFLHDFSGWLIFIFCFGFISLLNKVLNYIQPTEVAPKDSCPSETLSQGAVVNYNPYLIIALAILLIITPLTLRVAEVPPLPLLQSFDHFPHQLGDWQQVRRNYIDPEIFKKTGAHDYYEADFKNHDNAPASLYIAYAEKMEGGLAHNPKYCMVGGGWETIGTGTEDIFPGFPVHYLILKMGDNRILVYYWNLQQGKWMAKERLYYKAQIIFNSILTRRSDWALIRLITPVNPDLKEAQARLIDFARSITPSLPQFIQK